MVIVPDNPKMVIVFVGGIELELYEDGYRSFLDNYDRWSRRKDPNYNISNNTDVYGDLYANTDFVVIDTGYEIGYEINMNNILFVKYFEEE